MSLSDHKVFTDFAIGEVEKIKKQQKIVDAVNALQGELTSENCNFFGGEKYLHKTGKGTYCTVFSVLSDSTLICTAKKFNQYVKEMSFHGDKGAFADYAIALNLACKTGFDMQLQPKQIEWESGDKCICLGIGKSIAKYIGRLDRCEGDKEDWCAIQYGKPPLEIVTESSLTKPQTKEKRWVVYDSNGNFCSEHDYKYEPHDKTCQVKEIEINV